MNENILLVGVVIAVIGIALILSYFLCQPEKVEPKVESTYDPNTDPIMVMLKRHQEENEKLEHDVDHRRHLQFCRLATASGSGPVFSQWPFLSSALRSLMAAKLSRQIPMPVQMSITDRTSSCRVR